MKSAWFRFLLLLAGALACLALSPLQGCMVADDGNKSGTVDTLDPFPKPLGQGLIPLDKESYAYFRYVEFDESGKAGMRMDLSLHVFPMGGGLYGYAFDGQPRGLVLSLLAPKGDSAGVYLMGSFHDTSLSLDSVPVLWLPQKPHAGDSLFLGPLRVNVVESADTAFWTEPVQGPQGDSAAPITLGLQRHPTVLFRETKGDTVTFYHFRRGVGCVGFERAIGGKLFAAGSLFRYQTRP